MEVWIYQGKHTHNCSFIGENRDEIPDLVRPEAGVHNPALSAMNVAYIEISWGRSTRFMSPTLYNNDAVP